MISGPPWAGETYPVPQRLNGWRVVAAVKLPAVPDGQQHRYLAVVEANPSLGFVVHPVVYFEVGVGYQAPGGIHVDDWVGAMERFGELLRAHGIL